MAQTISDLLAGVCGMLLAGEIVSVVGAKGGTSLSTDSKCSLHLFGFSSSVEKMFPLRSRTGGFVSLHKGLIVSQAKEIKT